MKFKVNGKIVVERETSDQLERKDEDVKKLI